MKTTLPPETEKVRVISGPLGSNPSYGRNGVFVFKLSKVRLFCVVSDGEGWEHVSVHAEKRGMTCAPTWSEMCFVKDMFWEPEEMVIQYHPPKSQYKNLHPDTLHLWKPTDVEIPLPPREFV